MDIDPALPLGNAAPPLFGLLLLSFHCTQPNIGGGGVAPPTVALPRSQFGISRLLVVLMGREVGLQYRKATKKPLAEFSIPYVRRKLAKFGDDQLKVVEQSIEHGWQGLFALRRDRTTITVQVDPTEPW